MSTEVKIVMERTLKIGVIGTGHMGTNHVRVLSSEREYELIGVYDVNHEQAKIVAELYNTEVYDKIEGLLEEVDAVVIVVPSSLHKEIGLLASKHGVHALIEKPLATNSEDARLLTEAFKEKNLILQVGHIERFNAVVREMKKLLEGKDIFYIEAHRYSPFSGSGRISDVSVIEDLMIHDIDIVCDLMEPNEVIDIRGNGEKVRSQGIDFATCMLDFSSNAHAVINASRVSQNKERTIEVHTNDSIIAADLWNKTLTITQNTEIIIEKSESETYKQDGIVQKIFVPIVEPLRAELQSFYSAVVNEDKVLVDGSMALRAIEICEKVAERVSHN